MYQQNKNNENNVVFTCSLNSNIIGLYSIMAAGIGSPALNLISMSRHQRRIILTDCAALLLY